MSRLMDYFLNKYPYTDFHQLNSDWIISEINELIEIIDNFVSSETIKFSDPILWNITTQYAKSTIVLDTEGNAYLSKQAVPSGIQLNNDDYWLEIFNFTEYTRTANQNLTVNVETNTTRATAAYAVNDWLIWNDVLYKVTSAIAIDDLLEIDTNIVHFTVEDFLNTFITYVNRLILQYKNDIDTSEANYKSELLQEIQSTTATLSAQFSAAIAAATVDSEVIDGRVAYNTVTFPSIGDSIRGQITILISLLNMLYDNENTIEQYYDGRLVAWRGDGTMQMNSSTDYDTLFLGYKKAGYIQMFPTYIRAYTVLNAVGERVGQRLEEESIPIANAVRGITTQHDGYVYISVATSNDDTLYGYYYNATDNKYLADYIKSHEVDEIVETLNQLLFKSPNMVNPADFQANTVMLQNGVIQSSNLYDLITDIPVVKGTSYYISPCRSIVLLDDNNNVIDGDNTDQSDPFIFTPNYSGKLAINFYIRASTRYMQPSSYGTVYYPYGAYIKGTALENVLNGKIILNFGDSISNGQGNSGIGPAELVALHNGMQCNDYAVNGSYLAFNGAADNTDCVLQKVNDAINNPDTPYPDFILIDGGINDLKRTTLEGLTASQIIGTYNTPQSYNGFSQTYIDTRNTKTICGALETIIYNCMTKWPKAQIIIMFVHLTGTHFTDGTFDVCEYEHKIADKWNVPFFDMLHGGGLNLAVAAQFAEFGAGDRTHPNAEGYRIFYVPKLTALLKNLCPYYS